MKRLSKAMRLVGRILAYPVSENFDWFQLALLVLVLVCVLSIPLGVYVDGTAAIRNATADQTMKAGIESLKNDKETLDLAIEFGYDPLIVQVVRQEASVLFHQKQCKCPTWRFIRSDKELAYLILSIIQTESRGDYKALNAAGPAYGLTQLLFSTAQQYDRSVNRRQLLTIPTNLHIAITHFVELLEKYHGNYILAVIAWNRGGGAVDRSLAIGEGPDNGYALHVFTQAAMRNAQ